MTRQKDVVKTRQKDSSSLSKSVVKSMFNQLAKIGQRDMIDHQNECASGWRRWTRYHAECDGYLSDSPRKSFLETCRCAPNVRREEAFSLELRLHWICSPSLMKLLFPSWSFLDRAPLPSFDFNIPDDMFCFLASWLVPIRKSVLGNLPYSSGFMSVYTLWISLVESFSVLLCLPLLWLAIGLPSISQSLVGWFCGFYGILW